METNNLKSLLSKSSDKSQTPAPKQHNAENEILTSIKIPFELNEWIRDFQYNIAAETGNFKFSFKDALIKIISEYKEDYKTIKPRPDSFRESEKKNKR